MSLDEYSGKGFTFRFTHDYGNFRVRHVSETVRRLGASLNESAANSFVLVEGNLREVEIKDDNELPDALVQYLRQREGLPYPARWELFLDTLSTDAMLPVYEGFNATANVELKIDEQDSEKKDGSTSSTPDTPQEATAQ